jgi:hypothetical protein
MTARVNRIMRGSLPIGLESIDKPIPFMYLESVSMVIYSNEEDSYLSASISFSVDWTINGLLA